MTALTMSRSSPLYGRGNAQDGELVVEQSAVALLILVELGHGDYAELLLHIADGACLQLQNTDGSHGGVAVCEHLADIVLLVVQAVVLDVVGGVTAAEEELHGLLADVEELGRVEDHLIVPVPILLDDIHHAGAPVGVHTDVIVGDQTVDIPLGVLQGVTVVPLEQGDQADLLIQGPRAVLHVVVEVGLIGLGEEVLIENGDKGEAVQGKHHIARDGVLGAVVLHHLVEALGPPRLFKVQVLGLAEIGEGAI